MTREEMLNECVNRDNAIVQLNHLKSDWDDDWNVAICKCIETIKKLSSVTPQQKMGHWILTDDDFVYCSECEDSYYPRPIDASWYYCPHCGTKMSEIPTVAEGSDKE